MTITGQIHFGDGNNIYDGAGGKQSGGIFLGHGGNMVSLGGDGESVFGGGGSDTINGGAGSRVVQKMVGHASVNTTMDYMHSDLERTRTEYLQSHPRGAAL